MFLSFREMVCWHGDHCHHGGIIWSLQSWGHYMITAVMGALYDHCSHGGIIWSLQSWGHYMITAVMGALYDHGSHGGIIWSLQSWGHYMITAVIIWIHRTWLNLMGRQCIFFIQRIEVVCCDGDHYKRFASSWYATSINGLGGCLQIYSNKVCWFCL